MGIPAERITLVPTGTRRLARMTGMNGHKITEQVSPDSAEKVKDQLVGSSLRQGEFVIADLSVNNANRVFCAPVVFYTNNIQPPDADQVDAKTVVEVIAKTEGEKPKNNQPLPSSGRPEEQTEEQFMRRAMKLATENKLEFLMGEIANCEKQGLDARILRADVESLKRHS
ncbi:MAG: hypothetical protein A2857_01875 [Candidatus Levybacteria bacterium RIFCSPHIGHO2_01_FULL_36_15]|nr:MAG: hypothetical protein A2857_01875 [Candidatus Levybacteria bacterium RIFCSPHIGHO2_01_FULL_36_15]